MKELNMMLETGTNHPGLANPDRSATFEHGEVNQPLLSYSSLAANDVVNLQNEDLGDTKDCQGHALASSTGYTGDHHEHAT